MNTERQYVESLQPWLADAVKKTLDGFQAWAGVRPTITSGYRSLAQQAEEQRTNTRYPVNSPGDSSHQYGLGWDSSFSAADKLRLMPAWVAYRRAVGWQVPANDEVHSEYPGWRQLVTRAGVGLPGFRG